MNKTEDGSQANGHSLVQLGFTRCHPRDRDPHCLPFWFRKGVNPQTEWDTADAALVFIPGAFQSPVCFVSTLEQMGHTTSDVVIIEWLPSTEDANPESEFARYYDHATNDPIALIGRMIMTYKGLCSQQLAGRGERKRPVLVGHSFGAVIARQLAYKLPKMVGDVVEIAPIVHSRFSQLSPRILMGMSLWQVFQMWFFFPRAVFAALSGKTIAYPCDLAAGVFANKPNAAVVQHELALRPLSARLFLAVLFLYGTATPELVQARDRGWMGQGYVIAFGDDQVVHPHAVDQYVAAHASMRGFHNLLIAGQVHCWWMGPLQDEQDGVAAELQSVLS